jgi:hypothetical protein
MMLLCLHARWARRARFKTIGCRLATLRVELVMHKVIGLAALPGMIVEIDVTAVVAK